MALRGEHVEVNGKLFRILPFDVEKINANVHEGVPQTWHGVAQDGESGIFASQTVRFSLKSGRYPEIKEVVTHKIG